MSTYGREVFDKIGSGITVSADGAPKFKAGGITIDWASVADVDANYVFLNEDYMDGKFLRYGTALGRITAATDTTKVGKYVPFGATVAGGTIAKTKGNVVVLNESVHESQRASDHLGGAMEGGRVYARRILVTGLGDGTAAAPQGGSGATFTATVTAPGAGGTVTAIAIGGSGGSGYTDGQYDLVFTGGTPETVAAGYAVVTGGIVTSVTITAAGMGYDTTPTVGFLATDRQDADILALNLGTLLTQAEFEAACPGFYYVLDAVPA